MAGPVQELHVSQVCCSPECTREQVINLDTTPVSEEQPTAGTPPLLSLEQDRDPACGQRVLTQPLGPIHEVSIERTGGAAHFDMTSDGRIGMVDEAQTVWRGELQPAGCATAPVLIEHPSQTLVTVTAASPVLERAHQVVVARGEHPLGDDRTVVRRPPSDDRVERDQQRLVRRGLVTTDHRPEGLMMTLDGLGTGLDEQRVRARLSSVPLRPGLAGRVVADREAEEVESNAPVDGVSGVT